MIEKNLFKVSEMVKELDFDVLVPWVTIKDEPLVYFVENEYEKREQIQILLIEYVRARIAN